MANHTPVGSRRSAIGLLGKPICRPAGGLVYMTVDERVVATGRQWSDEQTSSNLLADCAIGEVFRLLLMIGICNLGIHVSLCLHFIYYWNID